MIRNIGADDAIFYDAGPQGLASQCWLDGVMFAGVLDTADEDVFGGAASSTHRLQYSRRIRLTTGALITIDSVQYKVVGAPHQIGPFDSSVGLVMVPA